MAYVIAEPCIGTKDTACVDACPVDCIHPKKDEPNHAEAELLYVQQLNIGERLQRSPGEFVIWDVGLGAAANAIAALRFTREIAGELRIVSFDNTSEPLEFALKNSDALGYVAGYEKPIADLLHDRRAKFPNGKLDVTWEFHLGDFPDFLKSQNSKSKSQTPPPHAIFYDAFSPAKNPAMWTPGLFTNLFQLLDPARPCALPTYSRSTMLRVTLLLAGFYVGVGHATGEKEETTLAANSLALLSEPLPPKWLERARVSYSAEPMWDAVYRQAPLSEESWAKLQAHPQWRG